VVVAEMPVITTTQDTNKVALAKLSDKSCPPRTYFEKGESNE